MRPPMQDMLLQGVHNAIQSVILIAKKGLVEPRQGLMQVQGLGPLL